MRMTKIRLNALFEINETIELIESWIIKTQGTRIAAKNKYLRFQWKRKRSRLKDYMVDKHDRQK